MPIRWSTFVTDAEGVVDYDRCKALAVILMAVAGCFVILAATVLEVTRAVELPTQMVIITATILVAPITGAAFGGMVGKHLQAKTVASATATAMAQAQTGETPSP